MKNLGLKLRPIVIVVWGLTACGRDPHHDHNPIQSPPSIPPTLNPEWSLTVGEPNEQCPGTFDRAVAEWQRAEDVSELSDAIAHLPKKVKQSACRVATFYLFDENFFATGFAHNDSDPQHSKIAFHPALFRLKPSLSQVLVWKDRQIVEQTSKPRFETAGAPTRIAISPDNFSSALRYILLHELGHIAHFQPEWAIQGQQLCSPDCDANSWEVSATGVKPGRLDTNDRFCYYDLCDKRVAVAELPQLYKELAGSDFVSLYASTNVAEDVAESYAAAILFDDWKWTWTIYAGETTFDSAEHWRSPQMAAKRDYFSHMAAMNLPPP